MFWCGSKRKCEWGETKIVSSQPNISDTPFDQRSPPGMAETRQTGDGRIQMNPGKFGRNRTKRAKRAKPGKNRQETAIFSQKRGKTGQKMGEIGPNRAKKTGKKGQKRANKTKPWQNRAKPKVSPNLGSGSVIPGLHDLRKRVFQDVTDKQTYIWTFRKIIFLWTKWWS